MMLSIRLNLFNYISDAFYFVLFFCLLFVGDYKVEGHYLLPYVSFFCALFFIFRYGVYRGPFFLWVVIFFFFLVFLFKALHFDDGEYSVFVFGFVSVVLSFLGFYRLLENGLAPLHASLFSLLAILVVYFFLSGDSARFSFIFGPTVFYRVIGFFWGVVAYYFFFRDIALASVFFWLFSILSLCLLFMTGSRGAVVVALTMVFVLSISFSFKIKVTIFSLSAALAVYVVSRIDFSQYRALRFGGESTDVRMSKFEAVSRFLDGGEYLWGASNPSKYVGIYPHNIMLEFLVYYGVLVFSVFFVMFLFFCYSAFRHSFFSRVLVPFVPIVVGAMFSGQNIDNYSAIALILIGGSLAIWAGMERLKVARAN